MISMTKKSSEVEILNMSVKEFALSQRTTSFIVSIMHHKLNSPLKVLEAKSRMMLHQVLMKLDQNESEQKKIYDKTQSDYNEMRESLDTIFDVTKTLKAYNELSKNETNLHKLFKIVDETFRILKDDDFALVQIAFFREGG